MARSKGTPAAKRWKDEDWLSVAPERDDPVPVPEQLPEVLPEVKVPDAAPKQPQSFEFMSLDKVMQLPPTRWLVSHVIPARGVGQLVGASRSGKSFLAIDLGMHIGMGLDWYGHRCKRCAVRWLELEGGAGIGGRFKAYAKRWQREHPGLSLKGDFGVFVGSFNLLQDVQRLIAEASIPQGAMVVVDTQIRAIAGLDENAASDMSKVTAAMQLLADSIGGVVMTIQHSGLQGATANLQKGSAQELRPRGSTVQLGDMDFMISVLLHKTVKGLRVWGLGKVKDGEDGERHGFRLEVEELGEDEDGEPITSCVAVEHDDELNEHDQSVHERTQAYTCSCSGHGETLLKTLQQLVQARREQWKESGSDEVPDVERLRIPEPELREAFFNSPAWPADKSRGARRAAFDHWIPELVNRGFVDHVEGCYGLLEL